MWPARGGRREPMWAPVLPDCHEQVKRIGYRWRRPYSGATVRLDKTGAWIAGCSSADVAHGDLVDTSGKPYRRRPGYYRVRWHRWEHGDVLPHPLGRDPYDDDEPLMWVAEPAYRLLVDLVAGGRWPEAEAVSEWTGEPVRLTAWINHVRDVRAAVLAEHGRPSPQYSAVKDDYGRTLSCWRGYMPQRKGAARDWYDDVKVRRRDWAQTFETHAAVILWRWADEALVAGGPDGGAVAVERTDEMVLPAATFELLTTQDRPARWPGNPRKRMEIDPTGSKLGTFKVKGGQ